MRQSNANIGEHIGISPLTKKQVKPKTKFRADHLPCRKNSASYDDFRILIRENKKFLVKLNEDLLIMRKKPSLNRNTTLAPIRQGFAVSSLLEFYFVLIVAKLFLLNGLFYYLAICKCMSTTVCVNGTVQFTFFLVIRLHITIVTNCNSLVVIIVT